MSGIYSGVQAWIVGDSRRLFVYNARLNLKLAVNDAVSDLIYVKNVFGVVEQIYVFFGHSIHRWTLLSSQCGEIVSNQMVVKIRLPRLLSLSLCGLP